MEKKEVDYSDDYAIFTFIARGNKEEIRNRAKEENKEKEYYFGKGAVNLKEKIIDTKSPLLKGVKNIIILNRGYGKSLRLSDILKYKNPVTVENASVIFNNSEKISLEKYNLDISDFVIGYEEQDERGDKTERERINKLILRGHPGYKIDGITLLTGDDLLKISVNGNCFASQVENHYNKNKDKNKVISLTYATAGLSSNWGYNIDDIVNKTKQEMSYQRVMFVNLKNFEKK